MPARASIGVACGPPARVDVVAHRHLAVIAGTGGRRSLRRTREQRAQRRHGQRQPHHRRHHLQAGDAGHLREIGQLRLARVVLLVGVGQERDHRVQRGVPAHVRDLVRVQRQPGLGHEHRLGQHRDHHVAQHEGQRIAAPGHRTRRIDAEYLVQRLFDPVEQHVDLHRRTAHHARQVQAQRPRQQQAGSNNDKHLSHGRLRQNDSGRSTT
ncbi:hypothetical protein G6F59_014437 [Rhizopus arrhizus]|nr:hypothetical protein G6F59_014437 [Rhizopus arrhizus]